MTTDNDRLREDNARRSARLAATMRDRPVSEAAVDRAAAPYRTDDPFEQLVRTYEAFDTRGTAAERRARARRAVLAEYGTEQAVRDMLDPPVGHRAGSGRTDAEWARVHAAARAVGVLAEGESPWGHEGVSAFEARVTAAEARGLPFTEALAEARTRTTSPATGPVPSRTSAPSAAPEDTQLREANESRARSLFSTREDT